MSVNNHHTAEVAVRVSGVSKSFKLPHEQHSGLKQAITSAFSRKGTRGYEIQAALEGITFEVEKGDFFGIVGRNGSGKSTLLKILSGIYVPNKGSVEVSGSLVPFIELGVGFNPELTGRENVFLNGALLGFTHKQVEAMYEEIVSFAELEKFMDQKLKNYSSGMQVRLAFSIAIRAESDILVLDEVLAVGDEAFQHKCNEYFNKIKKDKNQTVVLVTHSMEAVRRYCNKAILIADGEITKSGTPDEIADAYSMQFIDTATKNTSAHRFGSGEVVYENIKHTIAREKLIIEFDIVNQTDEKQDGIIMGFDFFVDGEPIFGNDTGHIENYKSGINLAAKEKRHFKVSFENNFGSNTFSVNMTIAVELGANFTDRLHPAFTFDSINVGYYSGFRILGFPEIIDKEIKRRI